MVQWLAFHLKSHTLWCCCALPFRFFRLKGCRPLESLGFETVEISSLRHEASTALARSHRKDESGADGHLYRCEDKSTTSGTNYSVCCSNDHKPLCHASLVLLSHVLLHPQYSVMLPFAVGSANLGVSVGVTLCSRRSIHAGMTLLEDIYVENAEYELPFASVTSKHLSKTPQEHMTNTCYKE